MNVRDFAEKSDMRILAGMANLNKNLSGLYVCDLLSWVMSHAEAGNGWITVHTHLNIVAVAVLTEVSCIIIPEGIQVEEATLKKADEESVVILGSDLSTYSICRMAGEYGI